jgi:aminopeptidase N
LGFKPVKNLAGGFRVNFDLHGFRHASTPEISRYPRPRSDFFGQTTDKLTVILERLETIAKETFFLTQVAVCNALGQIENAKAIAILQALSDRTPDGRVRRVAEEAVQKVQKKLGSDKAIQEIREELEKMKQENQELKSRLTKLEAKNS